jgi:hypothetical protein
MLLLLLLLLRLFVPTVTFTIFFIFFPKACRYTTHPLLPPPSCSLC